MINSQRDRRDIDYVKPYTSPEQAKKDLDCMKRTFNYYKAKRARLKGELLEKGLWDDMPEDYRYEMYALRTMMGILQVKITKCKASYKKLQKARSLEQEQERLKLLDKEYNRRTREYRNSGLYKVL